MAEIVKEPIVVKPVITERVIIKTADADVVIDYNAVARKASVVSLSEAEKELKEAQERLAQIPQLPSDKELLAWARANTPTTDDELLAWAKDRYPTTDYSAERMHLETIIAEISTVLSKAQ